MRSFMCEPTCSTLSSTAASGVPFGACLPSHCSVANISDTSHPMFWFIASLMPTAVVFGFPGPDSSVLCGSQRGAWTQGTTATVVIVGVLVLLVFVGSMLALCRAHQPKVAPGVDSSAQPPAPNTRLHRDEPLWRRVLDAFSLQANVSHLLSSSEHSGSLAALNGVRVLSMMLVLLGHAVLFQQLPGPGFINLGGFSFGAVRWLVLFQVDTHSFSSSGIPCRFCSASS